MTIYFNADIMGLNFIQRVTANKFIKKLTLWGPYPNDLSHSSKIIRPLSVCASINGIMEVFAILHLPLGSSIL
jgi:hypothetical protein